MDEQIKSLNKLIQDCFVIQENLIAAASHYRDLKAACDTALTNANYELHPELVKQIQDLDRESQRLPLTVLGEWPHVAELYHHNFYEVRKGEGAELISLD